MFSEQLNTGVLGAKVQSFRRLSPRELLIRSLDSLPIADRSNRKIAWDVFNAELEKSVDRDELLSSIVEYWFSNHYRSIVEDDPEMNAVKARSKTLRVEKLKNVIEAAVEAKAHQIALLELAMPNGKLLRECTGSDCKNASGWFGKIAKRIKPDEIVGKMFTENDLRELRGA